MIRFFPSNSANKDLVGVRERFASVQDVQNQIGGCQCSTAAADAFDLDFVAGFAEAGGVNEDDGETANVGGFLDGVAGGAGDGGDDGAVVAEELIEEAGFADVGAADNRGANSASQHAAFAGGAQEIIHETLGVAEAIQ